MHSRRHLDKIFLENGLRLLMINSHMDTVHHHALSFDGKPQGDHVEASPLSSLPLGEVEPTWRGVPSAYQEGEDGVPPQGRGYRKPLQVKFRLWTVVPIITAVLRPKGQFRWCDWFRGSHFRLLETRTVVIEGARPIILPQPYHQRYYHARNQADHQRYPQTHHW